MVSGSSTTGRPHVLIVSADPEPREFLVEGLMYGGFWTSAIASAIQTLEVFRLRSFDLVLIDATLSGVGATELVRRLRGRSDRGDVTTPRTDVPILLVSGDVGEVDPRAADAAGADGILSAPIDLEALIPRLHMIVSNWRTDHPDRPWADAAAQLRPDSTP